MAAPATGAIMSDIQISIIGDDDIFSLVDDVTDVTLKLGGSLEITMSHEQIELLYNALHPYFNEGSDL